MTLSKEKDGGSPAHILPENVAGVDKRYIFMYNVFYKLRKERAMGALTVLAVHNRYKLAGGEDAVFANEVAMLKKNGHKVIEYTRDNKEIDSFGFFRKLCLPFASIFSRKTYKDVKRIIKKEGVDIVHIHNTTTLISPSVFRAARKCGVPAVQTLHNFRMVCPNGILCREAGICERCVEAGGYSPAIKLGCYRDSKIQTLILSTVMRLHTFFGTYRRAYYIALTDFNKEKLLSADKKQKRFSPDRIFVKPNFKAVDTQPESAERKKQIVFVGRLEWLKGVRVLLDAWRDINGYELILYGDGPLREECEATVEKYGLSNVKVMGSVPNGEVLREISRSAALILPTQCYEGFPVTIAEAFACATPVLTSNIGNPAMLVTDGVTGYTFDAKSPKSIVEAVGKLQNARLYENCREVYEKKYTETANYTRLLSIYEKIINEEKTPH